MARVQRDCIADPGHVQGNAQKHSNSLSVSGYYVPGVQIKAELFVGLTYHTFFYPFSNTTPFARVIPTLRAVYRITRASRYFFELTSTPKKAPGRKVLACHTLQVSLAFQILGGVSGKTLPGRQGGTASIVLSSPILS